MTWQGMALNVVYVGHSSWNERAPRALADGAQVHRTQPVPGHKHDGESGRVRRALGGRDDPERRGGVRAERAHQRTHAERGALPRRLLRHVPSRRERRHHGHFEKGGGGQLWSLLAAVPLDRRLCDGKMSGPLIEPVLPRGWGVLSPFGRTRLMPDCWTPCRRYLKQLPRTAFLLSLTTVFECQFSLVLCKNFDPTS
jgi:hypothetical protein